MFERIETPKKPLNLKITDKPRDNANAIVKCACVNVLFMILGLFMPVSLEGFAGRLFLISGQLVILGFMIGLFVSDIKYKKY